MSKKTVIQAPGLERCPSKAQTIDRANRLLGDYDIAEPLPSPPPGVFDRAMDRANAHQLAQEEADIQPDTGSIASPRFTTGLSGIGIHIDPGAPPGSVSPPLSLKEFTAATDAIKPYWNPGKDGYVARKFITSEPAPSLSPSELTQGAARVAGDGRAEVAQPEDRAHRLPGAELLLGAQAAEGTQEPG